MTKSYIKDENGNYIEGKLTIGILFQTFIWLLWNVRYALIGGMLIAAIIEFLIKVL